MAMAGSRLTRRVLVGAAGLLLAQTFGAPARALVGPPPTYVEVLHSFRGPDGDSPSGSRIGIDGNGAVYGTTFQGGAYGRGTVYKLWPPGPGSSTWILTVLHSFAGPADGYQPRFGLVRSGSGYLYGSTEYGGPSGGGVIYRITPWNTFGVLHAFARSGGNEGPALSVAADSAGDVYGITEHGGAYGDGRVLKILPNGTATTRYNLDNNSAEGAYITLAPSGTVYGLTDGGGLGYGGSLFAIDPGKPGRILADFPDGEGGSPSAVAQIGCSSGPLYGTTFGDHYGAVFAWTVFGGLKFLHVFKGSDGAHPVSALTQGADGNLYGSTTVGGLGFGTLFRITPAGGFTKLYAFTGGQDGGYPQAAFVRDPAGYLYGTTAGGGAYGKGTVFRFHP
jgi:uncharacterized repeat protein (TIGR03803 family)